MNSITTPFNRQAIEYFMPRIGDVYDTLKNLGVTILDDVKKIQEDDFLNVGGTNSAKWNKVLYLKELIETRKVEIEDYYFCCVKQHEFPVITENIDLSIEEKASLAVRQLWNHLEMASKYERPYEKLSQHIKLIVLDNLDTDQLKTQLKVKSNERIRQLRMSLRRQFSTGRFNGICNLAINDDFLCQVSTMCESLPIYNSINVLNNTFGCADFESSVIRFFMDVKRVYGDGAEYKRFDQPYYIPSEQPTEEISKYINALIGIMCLNKDADIRPMTLGHIMESLLEHYPNVEYEEEIVETILHQHSWIQEIDIDNTPMYMLEYKHLKDYQKIARIIYEQKHVRLQDICDELVKRGDTKLQDNLHSINSAKQKYSWIILAGMNGVYDYDPSGECRLSLADEINGYALEKVSFTYDEVLNYLHQQGFSDLNEKSVRTYIMKSCQSSTNDSNLFCHSDFLHKFPDVTWRSRSQNGLFHWLLTKTIEFLKTSGCKATKDKIVSYVNQNNPEGYQLKNDLFSYLYNYIGTEKLFLVDGNTLQLTDIGKSLTDEELLKVGVRQKTPEYYKDAVSFILSKLKNAEGGEILLSSIKKECRDSIPEMPESAFYKIVDKFLPKQIIKVEIDGKLYLRIDESKIEYLPSYVIDENQLNDSTTEEPTLMASEVGRVVPAIGGRIRFTWDEIHKAMQKEFSFYSRWWDIETTMTEGIDKFIRFMQFKSRNNRLSRFIPQSIYEFWHFKNDEMDYYRYLIDITECYEMLLVDILNANTGIETDGDGLMGISYKNPDFSLWLNNSEYKGFVKTFHSLKHIRNKCAHGQDIDTGILSMIQNTTSFIALYVYTVARFWKERTF